MRTSFVLSALLLAASAINFPLQRPQIYRGWQMISVDMDVETMKYLRENDFDIYWTSAEEIVVLASPQDQARLRRFTYTVRDPDVQATINEETDRLNHRNMDDYFSDFRTYEEVYAFYQEIAQDNDYVTFIPSIGRSHEGRDIFAVIYDKNPQTAQPQFFIQGLQHAREWGGGSSVQYISRALTETNRTISSILDDIELIVVPIVNPDGHTYTWTDDRQWRKNRQDPPAGSSCYGIDLNRNWDVKWSSAGSSSNPCSNNYHGTAAFSEPETAAVMEFFFSFDRIIGAIDYHTSGQLILRPYGYALKDAVHEEDLFAAGEAVREAIFAVNGNNYRNIHSIELYQTSGTTSDWFYSNAVRDHFGARPYGWTLELTTSHYIPPETIIPLGEENVAGFEAFVKFVVSNPLAPDNEDPEGN